MDYQIGRNMGIGKERGRGIDFFLFAIFYAKKKYVQIHCWKFTPIFSIKKKFLEENSLLHCIMTKEIKKGCKMTLYYARER